MARRRMYGSATWCISMALITRVGMPICSSASLKARELMTVASMPMWSPVTRSMLRAAAATPRKMLPPPTTTPKVFPPPPPPPYLTAAGRYVGHFVRQGSHPVRVDAERGRAGQRLAAQFQQDALIARHWLLGCGGFAAGFRRLRIADFETHEAGHADVLAQLGDLGLHQLSHGKSSFLDERLFQQADLFVELGHAALDHLLDHLFGLALSQ